MGGENVRPDTSSHLDEISEWSRRREGAKAALYPTCPYGQSFPLCEAPTHHDRSGIADREGLKRRRGAVGRYEEGAILNIKEHAHRSGETNDAGYWNEYLFGMSHVRSCTLLSGALRGSVSAVMPQLIG